MSRTNSKIKVTEWYGLKCPTCFLKTKTLKRVIESLRKILTHSNPNIVLNFKNSWNENVFERWINLSAEDRKDTFAPAAERFVIKFGAIHNITGNSQFLSFM
ncbi:MAG: hypothetical protein HQK70_09150 [Desulfamplus sp.]|nr:hypothetical protein [Desulfamplus sp.]